MAGITGQSSDLVMWWKPRVYQPTMSVFAIERLALTQSVRPSFAVELVG